MKTSVKPSIRSGNHFLSLFKAGLLAFCSLTGALLILSKSAAAERAAEGGKALCAAEYVSPVWFDDIFDFSLGLAPAGRNGQWGYIDQTGKWAIPPQFEGTHAFSSVGLAPAVRKGKTGYINRKGGWEIEPRFDTGWVFDVTGAATVRKNGKYGVIDTQGNWVIEPDNEDFYLSITKSFMVDMSGPVSARRGGVWGIFRPSDNVWIDLGHSQIESLRRFSEGLAPAKIMNSKWWGYLSQKGLWEIYPQFEYAGNFVNGLAVAVLDGKYGFIGRDGNFVISPRFERAGEFYGSLAKARMNGKWGLIKRDGSWAVPPQFDQLSSSFKEAVMAPAAQGGKWGYINSKGAWIISPKFEGAGSFSEGLAAAKTGGKWGLINSWGDWVIAAEFDFISGKFTEGFAEAVIGEHSNLVKKPDPRSCPRP